MGSRKQIDGGGTIWSRWKTACKPCQFRLGSDSGSGDGDEVAVYERDLALSNERIC